MTRRLPPEPSTTEALRVVSGSGESLFEHAGAEVFADVDWGDDYDDVDLEYDEPTRRVTGYTVNRGYYGSSYGREHGEVRWALGSGMAGVPWATACRVALAAEQVDHLVRAHTPDGPYGHRARVAVRFTDDAMTVTDYDYGKWSETVRL
jgi:hypothetical protein